MTHGTWHGAVLPLGALAAAEAAMRMGGTQSDALAAPSAVLAAGWQALADGSLLEATLQTLETVAGGIVIGGGLGLLLGIWLGLTPAAARLSRATVEMLRPVPSVALIPLAMLLFGFGFRMQAAVISFACFWPMLLLSEAAVREIEPCLLEVSRMLGLGPLKRVLNIVLPAALPRLFVALRLVTGVALVLAITTEITANPRGLGYAMMSAQQTLQPALMLAFLLWVAVLGWGINALMLAVQNRLLFRLGPGRPA
ncbi:ABC transporter permease [Noviherbaspirillum sp. Root189]|uniref:ABC transporter permease n=1 Tax=Noviherbaspirillum sp. Root189 TaxID=1736487 RepID=UPI00070D48E3|nr:ABC transporter permease subunit [Noviherbaspirillum sp. Root189]KRB93548.1 ABC transporter permease [Noviherbaspirillum sp. Root189]